MKALYLGAVVAGTSQQDAITSYIKTVNASEKNGKALFGVSESSNQVFLTNLDLIVRPMSPLSGNKGTRLATSDVALITNTLKLRSSNEIIASGNVGVMAATCSSCDSVLVSDNPKLLDHCIVCGTENESEDTGEEEKVDLAIIQNDNIEGNDEEDESLSQRHTAEFGDDEEDEEDEDFGDDDDEDDDGEALSSAQIKRILASGDDEDDEDEDEEYEEDEEDEDNESLSCSTQKATEILESVFGGDTVVATDSDATYTVVNGSASSVVATLKDSGFVVDQKEGGLTILVNEDHPNVIAIVDKADDVDEEDADFFQIDADKPAISVAITSEVDGESESTSDEDEDDEDYEDEDDESDSDSESSNSDFDDDEDEDEDDESESESSNRKSKRYSGSGVATMSVDDFDFDDTLEVDALNDIIASQSSPVGKDISLVYCPSENISGHKWYAFVNGSPVAIACPKSVPENLTAIFGTDKFSIATHRLMEQVGICEGLMSMGYQPIRIAVPIKSIVASHVQKAVVDIQNEAQAGVSHIREDLRAALSTAAVGINKGFFANEPNHIKAALYEALSASGMRDAEVLIDAAFASSSDDYHRVLFDRAFDLISKPVEARNEISQAVAAANFQRTSSPDQGNLSLSSAVSARIGGMGEAVASSQRVSAASVAQPNSVKQSLQERTRNAVLSLSR